MKRCLPSTVPTPIYKFLNIPTIYSIFRLSLELDQIWWKQSYILVKIHTYSIYTHVFIYLLILFVCIQFTSGLSGRAGRDQWADHRDRLRWIMRPLSQPPRSQRRIQPAHLPIVRRRRLDRTPVRLPAIRHPWTTAVWLCRAPDDLSSTRDPCPSSDHRHQRAQGPQPSPIRFRQVSISRSSARTTTTDAWRSPSPDANPPSSNHSKLYSINR